MVSGDWIGKANLVRREFTLDQSLANVDRARSYIGNASPLEIHINGQKVGDLVLSPKRPVSDAETYYNTYDILPYLCDGENAVGVMLSDAYVMGNSTRGMLKIWYKDGTTQVIATGSDWKMTDDSPITRYGWFNGEDVTGGGMSGWDMVDYDDSAWSAAANTGSPVYDGVYHVGENAGMVYAERTFSGDYTIEVGMEITDSIGSIMFGTGNPNPAMWQFDGVNILACWDSQNHCMFGGGLTSWMFQGLGGIRSTAAAYHEITFRPGLESELTAVSSTIHTIIGKAVSDWTYENDVLDWTVTIPVNAQGKIGIPVEGAAVIEESGINVYQKDGNGLTYVGMEDGAYVYNAGSGTYIFHVTKELDTDAAAQVDALIEAIGKVTAESGEAIAKARQAYEALDDNLKTLVIKLDVTRAQRYYGTDNATCDVNDDGQVDIADLILILNHCEESY